MMGTLITYGKELIVDLHDCDPTRFTRNSITGFFVRTCEIIKMERAVEALYWWDDYETPEEEKQTEPHLKGTTAIQFMLTSNITIHTLDILKKVFINVFSCKDFDHQLALKFAANWFEGDIVRSSVIERM